MPMAVERAGRLDAALVGEPTNLEFAVAQRGLMMVDLVAHGDQRHAGYAATEGFTNAITRARAQPGAARRHRRAPGASRARRHHRDADDARGGVSRNVTPPTARAVLDIRSTPDWTHDELAALLDGAARLRGGGHLDAAGAVRDAGRVRRSWRQRGVPAPSRRRTGRRPAPTGASCGISTPSRSVPGTSRRSHTPDESVNLSEVIAARAFYARVIEEYLA